MKQFSIVAKKDQKSINAENKIKEALIAKGYEYNKQNPDLVICIGGDGTLLYAVHEYLANLSAIHFLALHTGTLGFFTDYTEESIDQCIKDIIDHEIYEIFESHLLEVALNNDEKNKCYALNEIRIENVCKTQTLDIYIDHEFFERVKGNGMCLSTQAGSTAYNRALKGAVIDSGLSLLQLVEIAGIQDSTHRSLGVPYIMKDSREITFMCNSFNDAYLCYDHKYLQINDVDKITCRLSNKSVKFIRFKKYSYLERLRNLY